MYLESLYLKSINNFLVAISSLLHYYCNNVKYFTIIFFLFIISLIIFFFLENIPTLNVLCNTSTNFELDAANGTINASILIFLKLCIINLTFNTIYYHVHGEYRFSEFNFFMKKFLKTYLTN